MKFEEPRLQTARLALRPVASEDLDVLHEFFAEPAVRRYLLDDQVMPREWVEEAIDDSAALFVDLGVGLWALESRGESPDRGSFLGITGFRYFFDPPQLQLLYALHPRAWGRGIATEAAQAVLQFAFESRKHTRVIGATDPPNTSSVSVMERCGMSRVQPRTFDPPLLETEDALFFAVSREEWLDSGARVLTSPQVVAEETPVS